MRGAAARTGIGRAAARDRVVEDAVRFIMEHARQEALGFALEVGEYLFCRVFRSSLALYERRGEKDVAISKIARDGRVDMTEHALHDCIHTYLLAERWGRKHPDLPVPDIDPAAWSGMWDLLDEEDEVFFRVLGWVAREKVGRDRVCDVVQTIGAYVEAGGKLDDLLVEAPPGGWRTPYARVMRMLGVERKWLASGRRPCAEARSRALAIVRDIEALLGKPSTTTSRTRRPRVRTAG